MKLNVGHLKFLVSVLKENLVGSYIHKFIEYSKTDYIFGNRVNDAQLKVILYFNCASIKYSWNLIKSFYKIVKFCKKIK